MPSPGNSRIEQAEAQFDKFASRLALRLTKHQMARGWSNVRVESRRTFQSGADDVAMPPR